jgi:hypothetical protein
MNHRWWKFHLCIPQVDGLEDVAGGIALDFLHVFPSPFHQSSFVFYLFSSFYLTH